MPVQGQAEQLSSLQDAQRAAKLQMDQHIRDLQACRPFPVPRHAALMLLAAAVTCLGGLCLTAKPRNVWCVPGWPRDATVLVTCVRVAGI